MGFTLTPTAQAASQSVSKEPNLVLEIDGVPTRFGSAQILKVIRIGDPGLFIDGSWVIGGVRGLEDQLTAISFDNSSSSIRQQLEVDKGRGSSIASLEIGLIDFNEQISELVSPGFVVEDILGRKASVFIGIDAEKTNFPDDYIRIFRGIIDNVDAGAGLIKINIAHPEQKKKASIYQQIQTQLNGPIDSVVTTIPLVSTAGLLAPVTGPDGLIDPAFRAYVRIDNEFIQYTGISGNNLTGCVRAQLGQPTAAHADEAEVVSFYRLTDRAMILALKLMMTRRGPFAEGVRVSRFGEDFDLEIELNTLYFQNFNIQEEFGLVAGDYVSVTGATIPGNNFSLRKIVDIGQTDTGSSFITVDGAPFTIETDSLAEASFRSQFDTLPEGLRLGGDETDVEEHLRIDQLFLSNFNYDFYLKETIENGRDWLEQEIYKPAGSYSINRKAKASVGLFVGPIPSASTKTLSDQNVTNPDRLRIRRSINKNFANTVVYKYEVSALEERFLRGVVYQSATSLDRIPVGVRALVIEASGMRDALLAQNLTSAAADRRLERFRFGAETLDQVQVTFGTGFNIELGDILILDAENLQLLNSEGGDRNKPQKFFEVINLSKDFRRGVVTLDLLDSNFDGQLRIGLISPSSIVAAGLSQTQLQIQPSYSTGAFGSAEFRKWQKLLGSQGNVVVKVRSSDFTTRFSESRIQSISGNIITLQTALGFTPQPGDVMELSQYSSPNVTEQVKLLYAHLSDVGLFPDGSNPYVLL